jgi:hypothetical protein
MPHIGIADNFAFRPDVQTNLPANLIKLLNSNEFHAESRSENLVQTKLPSITTDRYAHLGLDHPILLHRVVAALASMAFFDERGTDHPIRQTCQSTRSGN